jgi:hypothetical protein
MACCHGEAEMERRYGVTSSRGRQRAHAVIGNAAPVAYSLHCNATTDVSAAVLDFIACNSSALTVEGLHIYILVCFCFFAANYTTPIVKYFLAAFVL